MSEWKISERDSYQGKFITTWTGTDEDGFEVYGITYDDKNGPVEPKLSETFTSREAALYFFVHPKVEVLGYDGKMAEGEVEGIYFQAIEIEGGYYVELYPNGMDEPSWSAKGDDIEEAAVTAYNEWKN